MARHRYSPNARLDTPLAIAYRRARVAYRKAGVALRKSCSKKKRVCGFPRRSHRYGVRVALTSPSVKAMRAEFLSAPAGGGTNEDIIRAQLGHLDVRDATQFEPIAEKYEAGPLATFEAAFAVIARASRHNGRLHWAHFDLDALRACPGLEALQMPAWFQAAQTEGEERARFYGEEVPF